MIAASVLFQYENLEKTVDVLFNTQLWLEKAVIGLNLCPFAKAVHIKNRVRYAISAAQNENEVFDELMHEISILKTQSSSEIDTTLLIHPQALIDYVDFHLFQQRSHTALKKSKSQGLIQIATFHPHFQFSNTDKDDLENFTNRAPYPIHHLLRESSIQKAVEAFPDASAIYEKNIQTMNTLGISGWKGLWNKSRPKTKS
jgi:hypothetical protein